MLKVYGFCRVNAFARGNTRDLRVLWTLEEMGLPYEIVGIDHPNHDLERDDFRALNPFGQVPVIDDDGVVVTESGAILLYLAEKFGEFIPREGAQRAECLSWLFWQMGSAPYLGGGFGHFYAYAPSKMEYPINRFAMETKRQLDVLDKRLAQTRFIAGDDYTIADIAIWPWYGGLAKGWLYDSAEFLAVHEYKHVQRWADEIHARPAVLRGRMVNRVSGEPSGQLHERHDASDFDTQTEDKRASQP